ncbi:MAG TPA: two-component regulator propeller domain-containing protein [Opitutaceae bacterium]|nr:two-component regulator propeller domain-containing protein [Opitutaceae bacterium]
MRVAKSIYLRAAFIFAAAAAPATAGTQLTESGYAITIWQTEDGLPQNSVTSIAQTRDGYIWIGTYGGLARFDGVRFKTFDNSETPQLQDNRIVSLHLDGQDQLWIGHDSGRLTRYAKGEFSSVPLANRVAEPKIIAISSEKDGAVWALTESGTLENVSTHALLRPESLTRAPSTTNFFRDAGGALWVTVDGALYRLENAELKIQDLGSAKYSGFVVGDAAARNGGLWIARDTVVKKYENGSFRDTPSFSWNKDSITAMIELHDGRLAIGTVNRGLYILSPDETSTHIDHTSGLPQDWVRCLFEDREGNLWIGAGTGGLAKLHKSALSLLNVPDQWQGRTVLSVAPTSDGSLWVGTEGAGLYQYNKGEWQHFGNAEGLANPFVWSITQGEGGDVWVGTWGSGVYRLRGNLLTPRPELDPTLAPAFALTYVARTKSLWVGTAAGLISFTDGKAEKHEMPRADVSPTVSSLAPGEGDEMFVGLRDAGLGIYKNGSWTLYNKSNGLASDAVQCLLAEKDGTLWLGTTDGGLSRFKNGTFSNIGIKQGLTSNAICHIADDGLGNLWISTHRGILRIRKVDLMDCCDGKTATVALRAFDRDDGLPTVEFSGGLQAAGCRTTDGRLWFTSNKGLVAIDPRKLEFNALPPNVLIEAIQGDGRHYSPTDAIVLPPDNQRLEIEFTALSFTAPNKVEFKYRLEGFEKGWTQGSGKRSATYSHLPAGSYRLRVIAANNDGVWNETGAVIDFTVLPFFWQQAWFIALVAGAVIILIVYAARYEARRRLHRRLEALERQRAIESERTRIARDIHDDIGSSLTRITMLSQGVRIDTPEKQKDIILSNIYGTARELTRSLDEIVWAVDPHHDTLESLARYIGKFAQDFLSAANIRCRLDIPETLPTGTVSTQTRHHLFLAFKEALNNAVKHAGATEVKIALSAEDASFVVAVEDNGRGLQASSHTNGSEDTPRRAGHGLENMRERLSSIGGECSFETVPGGGTRILFRCRMDMPIDSSI